EGVCVPPREALPAPVPAAAPAPAPLPTRLLAGAIRDYRARADYPPHSRPLAADDADPIRRKREPTPVTSRGPGPVLTVFPEETSFEAPLPAVLYAYLEDAGRRVGAREITARLLDERMQVVGDIELAAS